MIELNKEDILHFFHRFLSPLNQLQCSATLIYGTTFPGSTKIDSILELYGKTKTHMIPPAFTEVRKLMLQCILHNFKHHTHYKTKPPVSNDQRLKYNRYIRNQRTNGPVNAHLISCPSKAQKKQNLENIW